MALHTTVISEIVKDNHVVTAMHCFCEEKKDSFQEVFQKYFVRLGVIDMGQDLYFDNPSDNSENYADIPIIKVGFRNL